MSSLYFPLASLLISLLLIIIFFNKQRQKNYDTKVYSKMIIISIIETITAIVIIFIAKQIGTLDILYLLNRIDFILITIWCSSLLVYVYNASVRKINKKITNGIFFMDVLFSFLLLIANFEILNFADSIDTSGLAPTLVGVFCAIYTVLMLCCLIVRLRNKDGNLKIQKYYPLFVFIVLITLSLLLRKIWPTMVLEPFMISFINLIMYFTIENPDLKMIEELQSAKDKAEKYSNDKAAFIFNMSQQIRTPLKNIESLSLQIIDENNIDIIKEKVMNIKIAAQRLDYIVNDSLDISTMEAKNLKLVESEYSLKRILSQISLAARQKIEEKNLKFNMIISEDIPEKLYGDPIRIKQILNTLLFNAIKYTEAGFIELEVSSVIKHDICRLIIKVEDSGCGMKTETINNLFEKHDVEECFTDNSTLTLDTLKKMLNFIGGTIRVESEPKKGSEFTIILDQRISKIEEEINSILNKKVLFICDDKEIVKQAKKMFDTETVKVTYVTGGEGALNKLRKNEEYDLIFINDALEKLDSITTLKRMIQIKGFKTPVIIMSRDSNKQKLIKYSSLGFSSVLLKPIVLKELDKILNKYLFNKK